MKGKIFAVLFFAILLASTIYAAASFTLSKSYLTFSQGINSTEFKITNSDTSQLLNVTFSYPTITGETGYSVTFTSPENKNDINESREFTLNPTSSIEYTKFNLGKDYSGDLIISNENNSSDNETIKVYIRKSFCDSGDVGGNLSLSDLDIDNKDGDDDKWKPLNNIIIEVEVENINADESDKIDTNVEIGLYNSKGKEYLDLDKVELGKIKGGDDKNAKFEFKVPADAGIDEGTYYLYIKAYEDSGEDEICTGMINSEYFKKISIDREDEEERQVVFDSIEVEPSPALCGEEVSVRAKIYNIGESDQEKIKSKIYNKELGVDLYEVVSDLDEGEEETVEFSFAIPKDATEKTYTMELRNLYGYDDDYKPEEDVAYDENSELFYAFVKVEGNCFKLVIKKAEISASLETPDEEVKAGKEVTIKTTIKNIGEEKTAYTVALEGNELFSTTKSITPSTLTLEPDESKAVLITLLLNKDAEGEQIFSIKTLFNGEEVKQQVSLSIPKVGVTGITGSAIAESFRENWFIWVIVIINIILILAIIIVAVKISRA